MAGLAGLSTVAIVTVSAIALAIPTPAEAQFRRGSGLAAGLVAGAVVGAIVAGSARNANAAPRPRATTRSATRSKNRGTTQAKSGTADTNATMQNVSGSGAQGATTASSRDPFAGAARTPQPVGGTAPAPAAGAQ